MPDLEETDCCSTCARADHHLEDLDAGHPYTVARATVALRLFGEIRTVEIDPSISHSPEHPGLAWRATVLGFVATVGRGSARYPTALLLDRYREGINRPRRGTTTVTDSVGRVWTFHLGTCVRNRQARIIGWADTAGVTNYANQTRASR
jgi:hypothetical protein